MKNKRTEPSPTSEQDDLDAELAALIRIFARRGRMIREERAAKEITTMLIGDARPDYIAKEETQG